MAFDYEKLCEENILDYGRREEHLELIGKLYADDTHFIYELLQNAEDSDAKSVYFKLYDDRLEVLHNGHKFSQEDVKAITKIAKSTKDGYTRIGKFGLGFKSVYAITDVPQIHSGNFNFNIEKYIRPSEIDSVSIPKGFSTLFILPFKPNNTLQIYERIAKRLQGLNLRTLLFLAHIEDIKYGIGEKEGGYLREKKLEQNGLLRVDVVGQSKSEALFVFDKKAENKNVEIAFLFDMNKKQIVPAENTDLVVYFPTEKKTELGFLINGNFRTTPARDNIPKDDEHNKSLIAMAADLLGEAIEKIKKARLCDISFLEALPILANDFPENSMFRPLFDKTVSLLTDGEYLPIVSSGFTSAKKASIARSAELVDLYTPADKVWLSRDITPDKTRELFDYLSNDLNIQVVAPETFARWLTEDFLKNQSDEWFIKFYAFLNGQKALWREKSTSQQEGILRSKPMIRIENDELKLPKDAFLPTTGVSANFPMVKKSIAGNKDAIDFLKALGLNEPDVADEIRTKTFPKYDSAPMITDSEYKSDLEQILSVLRGESKDAQHKLAKEIPNLYIVKCEDGEFRKPDEVYQNSELMKQWFQYSENVHFADNLFSPEDLTLLGVNDLPRRKLTDKDPKSGWHYETLGYAGAYKKNYILDGMDDFLPVLTTENCAVLAKVICELDTKTSEFFNAEQYYHYYYWCHHKPKNTIYDSLSDKEWILGKDGKLYKPSDITRDKIADDVAEIANRTFDFKKSEEKELEEKLAASGKRIVDAEEFAKYEQWKLSQQISTEDSKEPDWNPDCGFDDIKKIIEIKFGPIPENEGIGGTRLSKPQEKTEEIPCDSEIAKTAPKKAKQIGNLGEAIVKKHLIESEMYAEADIKILNSEGKLGTGRDFEVYKHGIIDKIIEVKSTTEMSNNGLRVSGKQWETARKEGDRYWIYVVFGVGSAGPEIMKIQNPIKKWKDGEIEADPVNFIIRK